MSKDPGDVPRDMQNELDRDQAGADLDQGIADREQARVDRDQEPLDVAQEALSVRTDHSPRGDRSHAKQTAHLALRQGRQDAHQAQLDQTQLAQGVRQDLLDQQQSEIENPPETDAGELDEAWAQATEELQEALRRRAEDALARAEGARRRAADTLLRVEAAQLRER
jgi:hypothetical protein